MYYSRQELHIYHLTSVTERLEACWERWDFHIERWCPGLFKVGYFYEHWELLYLLALCVCTYSHLILTTAHIPNQHAYYAIRITFSLPSARELKAID